MSEVRAHDPSTYPLNKFELDEVISNNYHIYDYYCYAILNGLINQDMIC